MLIPEIPENESARLAALRAMKVLDTPAENYLDHIAEVAAQQFGVPIALISLIDDKRQWFKARHGLDARELPREISFCGHAIHQQDIFCVPDARQDPRFADNPLVTGAPNIRFYAGKTLHAPGGEALGTLCVIDSKPRNFDAIDRSLLDALAQCVEQQFALRQSETAAGFGRRAWTGVLVTALAAIAFDFFSSQLIFVPNPPAILVAAVVFSAFHGGMRSGLVSAAIAWLYFAHFFSIPGQPFRYAGDNLVRVLVWAVATPAIAVMTGTLHRRSMRASQLDKINTVLSAHLTERAAATVELRRLHDQIQMVTDNAPTHIADYDKTLHCIYANVPYARWFGLGAKQIVGKHIREIVGDAMYVNIEPHLQRVMAGSAADFEGTRTHSEGHSRNFEAKFTPHMDADGQISGFYAFFNDVTEKAAAVRALLLKSAELERIIESMNLALVMFDSEGRFVRINPAAERLTGVPGTQVLGLSFGEAPWRWIGNDGDEVAKADRPFQRLRDGEDRIENFDVELALPDGRRISIIASAVALRDAAGRFLGSVSTYFDVTARKSAEAAVVRKSTELANLIESMTEGVAMLDHDDRYVLINAAAERILDTPRDQIIGRTLAEAPWIRVHADGTPMRVDELPLARLRQGEARVGGVEVDILLAGGKYRSLEVNFAALRATDGKFEGTITTFLDVTERKRTEELIHRSEQLKSATFAASLDAIISLDHEGRIIEFNPAAEQYFGFARQDVIGKAMVEKLVPPEMRAAHQQGFRRHLETGESRVLGRRMVMPALRADGTRIQIELAIIKLPDQRPPVFTAFARDVTEVLRAKEAARLSQARLARALDASKLALFEVEVSTGMVYLSEAWAEMIGGEPGETHIGIADLLGMVHPEERDQIWTLAMEALSGKRDGYDAEHRVRRQDGEWIWILSRCRIVARDPSGSVQRMAGTNVEITERKRTEQRMHYLATRDGLTELTNRALFSDKLKEAVEAASRQFRQAALISVGLDRFTVINDSLGQLAGDTVLKTVAARFLEVIDRDATVARPGGDEFLVLLPHIESLHEVVGCAENILAAISKPIHFDGHELVVTASLGVAVFPDDGESAGLLLRNADIALHNAKDAGRDNVRFFAESMNAVARSRMETEAAMRQGIAKDEFVVHYQPQINLTTGALIGFEALVRWQHPERGLIPPGDFIPLAESTGVIVTLGERVMVAACKQAKLWQRHTKSPLRIAVNVTARQFRHKGFVNAMRAALKMANLNPRLLELEITENVIMDHGPETIAMLDEIGKLGVQLAIDDFGTGYSSLSYLKRLPIDSIKIDQSFVADLPGDPDAGAIVGAIIALAHNLGLKVLAEGVETRAQFEYLRDHGCDLAQGYFFGRPEPPELLVIGDSRNVIFLNRDGVA